MNSLRQYLDILAEADAPAPTNPWEGKDPAKAEAWAKLSPQTQQKIGMADPTDEILVSNNVKGGFFFGKPVTDANPDGTPKVAAAPAQSAQSAEAPPAAPVTGGDTGEVPGVTTQSPAQLKPPSAGAGAEGNAGEVDAQIAAATPPAQSAQAAGPKNRDSMSFSQAFADARKDKESTFPWKGKSYNTELAKPQSQQPSGITTTPPKQGAMSAPAAGADPMTTSPEYKQLLATLNATFQSGGAESPAYKQAFANFNAFVNKNKPVSETVSFADDTVQRIVSLVHYR